MEEVSFDEFDSNLYVLSMIGSEENVENVKNKLNIDKFNVFYGLNYKKSIHNINFYSSLIAPKIIMDYMIFNPGALACVSNHYYAVQEAYKSGKEFAFFIEDDVFPVQKFDLLNMSIKELPEDFDCLNFGWIPSIVVEERNIEPTSYSKLLYKKDGLECSGAFGYLLSKKGMEKYISILKDNIVPSDFIFSLLDTYYMKNPFLGHPPAYVPSRIRNNV